MKATDFVKKLGWREAQICLLNCAMPQDKWFMRRGDLISGQDFDDLKQIVEAFELVESYGGLKDAKKYSSYIADISWTIHKKIEKYINLVEQCQND